MPGSEIDGGEILVQALCAESVEAVFAIADVSYTPIFRSADAAGMRVVGGRHESANVHMADAWYRATGRVAVAMGTMGPGYANMIPGVITAALEGIPVIVLATQRTQRIDRSIRRGRFQWTPQLEAIRPLTKFAGVIPDARRIPEYVREAFRCALAGRPGPVYLEIDGDILREKVEESRVPVIDPARYRAAPGAPDAGRIEAAAELLAGASLPLALAGSGVLRAAAWEELRALVEYAGAVTLTTLGARGAISEDHPQHLPFVLSQRGTPATRDADVVLAIGTPVGETLGYGRPPVWGAPGMQRWIHLDADPHSIGVNREVDVALVGDARAGLRALLEALKARSAARPASAKAAGCVATAGQEMEPARVLANSDATPIHPARLAREVADFVPRDAIVCLDGGNTALWAHQLFRFYTPRSLLWTSHLGHLGTGLPYAIGAKLARPDRPVYLYSGDGAFGFNLQELETASRVGARVVVVVASDFAWGMEHAGQMLEMGKLIGVKMTAARYDEVARGLGCHGERVERPEDIRPALERAAASGKPAVVQVLVDPDQNVSPPRLGEFARMYDALED